MIISGWFVWGDVEGSNDVGQSAERLADFKVENVLLIEYEE